MASTDNHWTLVQTPTGKIIERAKAEVLEAEAWVCEDPGHYGIYFKPGACRICGKARIKKVVPIGFQERSA
ncbi:MAG TPA: hypothetical protein ENK18_26510 [Deltaproteobacteria bacterium]|nr:hypothetical protein [Deltaproteobacteria bacterium]